MKQLLLSGIIAGVLFITFLIFVIKGVIGKNRKNILISLIFLLLSLCIGSWFAYTLVRKTYHRVADIFEPRSGIQIYTALFGKPVDNCVVVTNKADQIVPRLDCCIWLEFTTCPAELRRIISQYPYEGKKYLSSDTSAYTPMYSPRPSWWTPQVLIDSIIVMQDFNFENPNRDKILIFSIDSTHAFYCDMAD